MKNRQMSKIEDRVEDVNKEYISLLKLFVEGLVELKEMKKENLPGVMLAIGIQKLVRGIGSSMDMTRADLIDSISSSVFSITSGLAISEERKIKTIEELLRVMGLALVEFKKRKFFQC